MIIFVYGEDTFRVSRKILQLREHFCAKFDKDGHQVTDIFGKPNQAELSVAMRSGGLFASQHLFVLHDALDSISEDDVPAWAGLLLSLGTDVIVVFSEMDEAETIESHPLFTACRGKEGVHTYPFPALPPAQLGKWVSEEATEAHAAIEPLAVRRLLALVGNDTWQIHHEVQKLAAFANGRAITSQMVSELVQANFEERIFDFIDAVSRRDGPKAMKQLSDERSAGTSDGYLQSMLARQLRILIGVRGLLDRGGVVSKDTAAKELSIHPFAAQKALEQAKRYTIGDLLRVHDVLFHLETDLRHSRIKQDFAVEQLIAAFLGA